MKYYFTNREKGLTLKRYWTNACGTCGVKDQCATRIQRRLEDNTQAMRTRRETVEHPFGTIKARMGAAHFLMKRVKNAATEMALHVLAYNLTRVMNNIGIKPLIAAKRCQPERQQQIICDA